MGKGIGLKIEEGQVMKNRKGWVMAGIISVMLCIVLIAQPVQGQSNKLWGELQGSFVDNEVLVPGKDTKTADDYYHAGNQADYRGQGQEAVKNWLKAIELNPKHASAHMYLGLNLYYHGAEWGFNPYFSKLKGISHVKRAIRITEGMGQVGRLWEAYFGLAKHYEELRLYDKAIAELQKVVAYHSNHNTSPGVAEKAQKEIERLQGLKK